MISCYFRIQMYSMMNTYLLNNNQKGRLIATASRVGSRTMSCAAMISGIWMTTARTACEKWRTPVVLPCEQYSLGAQQQHSVAISSAQRSRSQQPSVRSEKGANCQPVIRVAHIVYEVSVNWMLTGTNGEHIIV